jgi:hypothetical protein
MKPLTEDRSGYDNVLLGQGYGAAHTAPCIPVSGLPSLKYSLISRNSHGKTQKKDEYRLRFEVLTVVRMQTVSTCSLHDVTTQNNNVTMDIVTFNEPDTSLGRYHYTTCSVEIVCFPVAVLTVLEVKGLRFRL